MENTLQSKRIAIIEMYSQCIIFIERKDLQQELVLVNLIVRFMGLDPAV